MMDGPCDGQIELLPLGRRLRDIAHFDPDPRMLDVGDKVGLQIRAENLTLLAQLLSQPLRHRAEARTDLEAAPARFNADLFQLMEGERIQQSSQGFQPAALGLVVFPDSISHVGSDPMGVYRLAPCRGCSNRTDVLLGIVS